MSDDVEVDDFVRLFKAANRTNTGHVEARRQKEARAMSGTTAKRARRGETKTVQLNMRVTASFKKSLMALAASRGVSAVELIEIAVEALTQGELNGSI